MTPRRLFAWCEMIRRERYGRYIELLHLHSLAASGNGEAIKKQLTAWEKEV